MTSAATTTCCGVVLAVGLTLPVGQPPTPQSSPPGPTAAGFTLAWSQRIDAPGALRLTAATGVVVISGAEAPTQARAVATGELRWTDAHQATIAPAVAGDLLFLAAQQQLIALTLATGRELWSTGIDETIDAVVAKGDHVVIASANGFRVLQAKDGRQLWSKAVTDRLSAAPAIDAGRLFVATSDGTLQAFDVSSGTPRWQTAVGTAVGELFTQPERLYARGDPEGLFAYRQDRAWPRWSMVNGQVLGQPAMDDERVYVTALDNTIVALDRGSGTRKWKTSLDGRPLAGPVLSAGMLVVPLTSGAIATILRKDGKLVTPPGASDTARRPDLMIAFAASADGAVLYAVTEDAGANRSLSALRRE